MAAYRLQPHSDGSVNLHKVQLDEVSQHQNGRCISCHKAVWRILSFLIHERHPPFVQLGVHLENEHSIYFIIDLSKQAKLHSENLNILSSREFSIFVRMLLLHKQSSIMRYPHIIIGINHTQNGAEKNWKKVREFPGVRAHQTLGRVYCIQALRSASF